MDVKQEDGGGLRFRNHFQSQLYSVKGYPASYVFGFSGYSERLEDFAQAIQDWGNLRQANGKQFLMRHVPCVVAAKKCVAIRNAPPFLQEDEATKCGCLVLAGRDPAPLRMLVAHLLHTIQAKVPWLSDSDGLRSDASNYLGETNPFDYTQVLFCERQP